MNEQTTQEVVARDQRRDELAAVDFAKNGQLFQPKNGRELMDMANMMSGAGFMVKDIYRKNPGACMGLIAVCAPYGMNPIQVSWKTYQTKADGPIAYEAQVMVAMVNSSGAVKGSLRYRYEGEGQDRVCIASATLVGDSEPVEVRIPRLGDIKPQNSPLWKGDPDQQLAYYTGRNWARRYKPEMLLGVYDVDEVEGFAPMRDVTPREGGFADRAIKARLPQESAATATEARPEAEVVDAQVSDPAGEDEPVDSLLRNLAANGAPTSDAFDKGVEAFEQGHPITSCRYDLTEARSEAEDWCAGWVNAERAKA